MSDTLERRLRETLERRAMDVGTPPAAPPLVLKRAHRRQARTVMVATVTVAALAIGSFAGIRALTGTRGRSVPVNGGSTKTATVRGVTITYLANWYLERFDQATGSSAVASSAPLFALANFTPSVPFVQA